MTSAVQIASGWRRVIRHKSFALGMVLTLSVMSVALLSLVWTPHSPYELNAPLRLAAPSASHWLGTDAFGRDVFSLLMVGAQASIVVGIIAIGIGLICGTILGCLAAATRGWLEELVMRFSDFAFAFPAILTAIMLTAVFGAGITNAIVAIGIFNIPVFARVTRAAASTIWVRDFILAARMAGKGALSITQQHILPNILPVILVQATIQFAIAILAEAALSYLGLGTQPPQPSWGRMLSDAQTLIFTRPELAIYPGLVIAIAVLGLNLLGDGLRDLLDPKLARIRS